MVQYYALLCSELSKCQKVRSVISVKIQKYSEHNIDKIGCFFHMILKDIYLAMSLKEIILDAARLAQYFVKLIARPISFCIMLKPSNFISI